MVCVWFAYGIRPDRCRYKERAQRKENPNHFIAPTISPKSHLARNQGANAPPRRALPPPGEGALCRSCLELASGERSHKVMQNFCSSARPREVAALGWECGWGFWSRVRDFTYHLKQAIARKMVRASTHPTAGYLAQYSFATKSFVVLSKVNL